jgi:hypothetical protein
VHARLQVFRKAEQTWGLRTLDGLPAGGLVCELLGEIVAPDPDAASRMFRFDPEIFQPGVSRAGSVDAGPWQIDASSFGNISRFVADSEHPNLCKQTVRVATPTSSFPRLALFAYGRFCTVYQSSYPPSAAFISNSDYPAYAFVYFPRCVHT